ncbi:MAG: hypothetical protein RML95_12625 [Anaerolineae bacterium]|nr:hypothetical protein [Anaerolineae bacterium]MDW8300169.1 hypothetical protein [Anaerolineae bacterium]
MFKQALEELFHEAEYNPLLWLAIKHEHGARETFKRFERRLRFGAYGLALLLTLPTVLAPRAFFLAFLELWLVTFVSFYALGFAVDAAYALAARFSSEVRGEFWEALRLTLLPPAVIAEGKYLNGQLRAWRWLLMETAGRHCLAAWLIFMIAGLTISITPLLLMWIWLILVPILVLAYGYVSEPLWRMRAVVALSFAMALRIRDEAMAILVTLGIAFSIRLLQIVFVITIPLQLNLLERNPIIGFAPWLYILAVYVFFYGTYWYAHRWAWNTVLSHIEAER